MSIISSVVKLIGGFVKGKKSRAEVETEIAARGAALGLRPLESFVDLQKTLDLDSDFESREEAYIEAGGKGKYRGDAGQNQWMVSVVIDEVMKGYIDLPDKG